MQTPVKYPFKNTQLFDMQFIYKKSSTHREAVRGIVFCSIRFQ
jgi:hypothetical protein